MKNIFERYKDAGLLLIRVGVGAAFVFIHGLGKLTGGIELWKKLGASMSNLGITFFPEFWGFMAMFSEFFCGILLVLGLFFRPAAAFLTFTMFVAMMGHLSKLDPWGRVAHSLEMLFVFAGLVMLGAGKYSLDYLIYKKKKS